MWECGCMCFPYMYVTMHACVHLWAWKCGCVNSSACCQFCFRASVFLCASLRVHMHVCVCVWYKCETVWLFHHLCPPCPQISASHPDTLIKHGSSFSAVFCVECVKRFLKWPYPVSSLGCKLSLHRSNVLPDFFFFFSLSSSFSLFCFI